MSYRHLFYIGIILLSIYAWKDWFVALCGLILMMAVISHENMPTGMYDIQGLNLWNVLFLMTFLAWVGTRRHKGLIWDMPRNIQVLLLMNLGIILAGLLRAIFDRSYIEDYPIRHLIGEELINTVKWVIPGILLFDGCRTRKRSIMVLVCVLAVHILIAIQTIHKMPLMSSLNGTLSNEGRARICTKIGYCASDLSTYLAGASWGILAALPLVRKRYWILLLISAGIVILGQALTGGRAGYLAWGATGLVLCLLKWRKYLILAPVIVILLPILFPGPVARMLTGFHVSDVTGQSVTDDYAITSGRTMIWPYVVDKIRESPLIGYGRLAMKRTGLREKLMSELGEDFPTPHNMYLETLLDNGILGSIPIFLFWSMMVIYSGKLFRSDNYLCSAVGGLALSLVLAQLFAGIGSQHFYPRESTMCMWMAMFLSLRVYIEERQARICTVMIEDIEYSQLVQQQTITPLYPH